MNRSQNVYGDDTTALQETVNQIFLY